MRALLVFACLVASPPLLQAEDLTPEQKKQIEDLRSQIDATKKLIAEKQAELSKLETELAKLLPKPVLFGEWEVVEETLQGGKVVKGKDAFFVTVHFEKTSMTIATRDLKTGKPRPPEIARPLTYTFDDTIAPAKLTILVEGDDGKYVTFYRCIYKADGDELTIVFGIGSFPKKFEPSQLDVLVKLRRKK